MRITSFGWMMSCVVELSPDSLIVQLDLEFLNPIAVPTLESDVDVSNTVNMYHIDSIILPMRA